MSLSINLSLSTFVAAQPFALYDWVSANPLPLSINGQIQGSFAPLLAPTVQAAALMGQILI
jgi:hypothetical protein